MPPTLRDRALACGRLLRLSLFPSAAADAAAGAVLGAGAWPAGPAPWLLVAGALCVYHGGLALNDWADRERDRATRPERPLPSGALAPAAALGAALGLLVAGAVLGVLAARAGRAPAAGALLAGVALLAVLYDLAGRGPWSGPLLLGACRAGNLGAGVCLGAAQGAALPAELWAFPLVYGAYVLTVSRLGRMEDAEDARALGDRPARLLRRAALALLVAPLLGWRAYDAEPVALAAAVLVGAAGALGLLRLAARREPWQRPDVLRAMGAALRRLLVFGAVAALVGASRGSAVDGWIVAALVLAGFPVSYALRRVFPPS